MFNPRHTIAEINLGALASNLSQIKSLLNPQTKIMPIIKANAYGHGAVAVARKLEEIGVEMLGVACLYEVIELRNAGVKCQIVNVDPTMIGDVAAVFEYDYQPTVFSLDIAAQLSQMAVKLKKIARIHIKVDTGMNRVGVDSGHGVELILAIKKLPNIEIEGLFTHFANADNPNSDFTKIQLEKFEKILRELENMQIKIPLIHAANSAGILFWPSSHFNLVRLGVSLYGYSPNDDGAKLPIELKPVLSLKTYISHIKKVAAGESISYGRKFITQKESTIITLPIGYGDGLRRSPQNWGEVILAGKKAPIVGVVCMDQTMVDASEINDLQVGDEVVLIGRQGGEQISGLEIAKRCGTIVYEVLTGLMPRVTRVYVD